MFGIDRQKGRPGFLYRINEQGSRTDQALLVCQRDRNAPSDRLQSGGKARRADDRGHNPMSRSIRRLDQSIGSGSCLDFSSG